MAEDPGQPEQPAQDAESISGDRKRQRVPLEVRERQLAPKASFWPFLVAITLVVSFIGVMTSPIVLVVGAILTVGALIGWVLEKH